MTYEEIIDVMKLLADLTSPEEDLIKLALLGHQIDIKDRCDFLNNIVLKFCEIHCFHYDSCSCSDFQGDIISSNIKGQIRFFRRDIKDTLDVFKKFIDRKGYVFKWDLTYIYPHLSSSETILDFEITI